MGMPKINLSALRCPQCAGPARLVDANSIDTPEDEDNELLSFECDTCGPFTVLALADGEKDEAMEPRLARPGTEWRDLWA